MPYHKNAYISVSKPLKIKISAVLKANDMTWKQFLIKSYNNLVDLEPDELLKESDFDFKPLRYINRGEEVFFGARKVNITDNTRPSSE